MLELILFSSLVSALISQTGNWCEVEQERNYEVVVSPRLEDSGNKKLFRRTRSYLEPDTHVF